MLEVRTTFKVTPSCSWSLPARTAVRWLAPSWTMLPLAARLCRVRNPLNGAVAELSADQYAVLTACEGCKTLEEHGTGVRRKLGVPDQDWQTISQWLSDFVSRGLFTSLDDLVNRLDIDAEWTPAPCAGMIIRTSDRPGLLARVLKSAAVLEQRVQSRYRFQVLDDSRDGANIAVNRKTIAECGLDCIHHDLSQEHAIAAALRIDFPAAARELAWLFGQPRSGEATYGRPVNLALLMTAGRRVLMLDDDAVLDPRLPPVHASGLEVSCSADELFCFGTDAELNDACPAVAIDPIAAHLEVLGAPVGRLWHKHTGDTRVPAFMELSGQDAPRFVRDARVLVTQNHAVGDPGSSMYPYHLLTLPVASREQLLGVPERLSIAFHERHNWRGRSRTRLTPNRPLTFTTLAGLDNSVLLPPTVRSHRNEDLLLGDIIRYLHMGAWSFDLPWGLPHRRQPAKHWLDASNTFPQEPVHFVMDYLEQRAPNIVGEAPTDRMSALAATLLDLSDSTNQHVAGLLEQQAADTASRVRYAIQGQLDDPSIPAVWKQLLPHWLNSPTLATTPDTLRRRLASTELVRSMAQDYGRALTIWPDLWAWARNRT